VTTEDVKKIQFRPLQGRVSDTLKDRVARVEIVIPWWSLSSPCAVVRLHDGVRHHASAAGLIVPKNYLTQVGDDGSRAFQSAPPLQFVSSKPGWRSSWKPTPATGAASDVKTLVMRTSPEQHARRDAETARRTSRMFSMAWTPRRSKRTAHASVASKHASVFWIEFPAQWDTKSPWHDFRLRQQ